MAHDIGFGLAVFEKSCVRLEEAPPLRHEGVIASVKCPEAPWIHLHEGGVIIGWTLGPQLSYVVAVKIGVRVTLASIIVYAIWKLEAMRGPQCVPT